MYAALWRVLPGPVLVKIAIIVALVALVLFVLAVWIFPWISELLTPIQEVTVDQ